MTQDIKIGIITFQGSINYGATLQTYALQKYIQNQGYDCEIINLARARFRKYVPSKRYRPFPVVKNKTGIIWIVRNLIRRLSDKTYKQKLPLNDDFRQKIAIFRRHINTTRLYCSIEELYDNPPKYDLYITGSDQVWNPYRGDCVEPYFLTFAPKGAARIAYAASLGVNSIDDNVKAQYRKWLKDYSVISVREETGRKIVQELTDKHVEHVLDPTFLLTKEEWLSLSTKPIYNQPYILLYTLQYHPELLAYCKKLGQESGMQLLYLTQRQPATHDNSYISIDNAGVEDFIGLINCAELMITNSFHGTVMALQTDCNNVFTVPVNHNRDSRITDIYELFDIKGHILDSDLCESYGQLKARQLDRAKINQIIKKEADKSRLFILDQLEVEA